MEPDHAMICAKLHRSAYSHFERSQNEGTNLQQQRSQIDNMNVQQQMQQEFREILVQMIQKHLLNRKLRRRQRQERHKKRSKLAMLNQVAARLRRLIANRSKARKSTRGVKACSKQHLLTSVQLSLQSAQPHDFEHSYFGDASAVTSFMMTHSVHSVRISPSMVL